MWHFMPSEDQKYKIDFKKIQFTSFFQLSCSVGVLVKEVNLDVSSYRRCYGPLNLNVQGLDVPAMESQHQPRFQIWFFFSLNRKKMATEFKINVEEKVKHIIWVHILFQTKHYLSSSWSRAIQIQIQFGHILKPRTSSRQRFFRGQEAGAAIKLVSHLKQNSSRKLLPSKEKKQAYAQLCAVCGLTYYKRHISFLQFTNCVSNTTIARLSTLWMVGV